MKEPHTLEDCKAYIDMLSTYHDTFDDFPPEDTAQKMLRVMRRMWSGWDNQAALLEKAEKELKGMD